MDKIVAYKGRGALRCPQHAPDDLGRDWIPVTAEDLEDGGLCTYPDCGRDVLCEHQPCPGNCQHGCRNAADELIHLGQEMDRLHREPKPELCGGWGGCPLPQGHNMGQADIPANHHSQTPCPEPEYPCGHLDGEPCDFHAAEIGHASNDHEWCDQTCETKFPSEQMRNSILYSALPGSRSMLDELLRRAEQRSPRAALLKAHAALAESAGKIHRIMSEQAEEDLRRIRELESRVNRLRIAWGRARTRALSAMSGADRYCEHNRELLAFNQEMLASLLGMQIQRDAALKRVKELEAELRIGEPWTCPCCSKENRRDVCAVCETDRPETCGTSCTCACHTADTSPCDDCSGVTE